MGEIILLFSKLFKRLPIKLRIRAMVLIIRYRPLHELALPLPLLPRFFFLPLNLSAPATLPHCCFGFPLRYICITFRSRLGCHLFSEAFPSILFSHCISLFLTLFSTLALTTIQQTIYLTCLFFSLQEYKLFYSAFSTGGSQVLEH